jgi:hypothetical protein
MSVRFTQDAVRQRRKTVTRRKGWTFLKPGHQLTLCTKTRGRKAGEPLERITTVEVVDVRRERLGRLLDEPDYAATELALEGMLPPWTAEQFIQSFFTEAQGINPNDVVTRIEWRYLDQEGNQ